MSESVSKFKRLSARLRGTAAEEIPVPFEIQCDCGRRVTGFRNSSWQQCGCPDCHTALFLLPTNAYPSTDSVGNDVIGGTFGHRFRVVIGEVLPSRRKPGRPPAEEISTNGAETVQGSSRTETPTRRLLPKISLPKVNPGKIARRTFTPFRSLVTGMLLVVGLTGFWILDRSQREAARSTWHESIDAIPALIEHGEFEALQETLGKATDAGRRIGQSGREWRHVLNLFQETQALTSVCYATLPALLSEASARQPFDDRELQSLESDLKSGTFVIDGYIDPQGSEAGQYFLDIPAMSGQHPVSVTMQLPQLDDYMNENAAHRFVFAFRLASVKPPQEIQHGVWDLCVDAESFVLLTSEEHCHFLGFSMESDPALGDLLGSQRTFVEDSDRWARRHEELAERQASERESHQ